jgi:hypothetical protein
MVKLFYVLSYSYSNKGKDFGQGTFLTVYGIFVITIFCCFLTLKILFDIITANQYKHIQLNSFASITVITALFYFMFLYKKRYQSIIEKYRNHPKLHTQHSKWISFGVVFLLILSPFIVALITNKIRSGNWV